MSTDNLVMLVASEARQAMPKDGDLTAKVDAAMQSAANHWMVLDPELQLKGALAALLLEYQEGTPEGERLRSEVRAMQQFSGMIAALQAGIPVDLEAMVGQTEQESAHERIGLVDAWRRANKQ